MSKTIKPDKSQNSLDQNSDSTRDRILLEAGPIFASKGYRGTTVREICDRAQVNLASINYYFGDKQKLYTETVLMARQMRAKQVPQPDWTPGTSPTDKLGDFIRLILTRAVAMKSEPWQVRLLMREILQPTEACRQLVKEYFRPTFDTLLEIVDEVLETKLPEHRRQQIGLSIIGQCMYYRFAADMTSMMIDEVEFEEHFDIDGLAKHITEFSVGALTQLKNHSRLTESKTSAGINK